jgi:hypothetical protein
LEAPPSLRSVVSTRQAALYFTEAPGHPAPACTSWRWTLVLIAKSVNKVEYGPFASATLFDAMLDFYWIAF